MTYEERVVRDEDRDRSTTAADRSVVERRVTRTPSGGELAGRVVILLFGIVQVFIILRIVLLLLNAREGNDLVAFILNTSQIFVAPFNGMLQRRQPDSRVARSSTSPPSSPSSAGPCSRP